MAMYIRASSWEHDNLKELYMFFEERSHVNGVYFLDLC